MKWIKNLYDALMRWAQSPSGPHILFIAALIESLFSIFSLSSIFIVVAFVAPKRSYHLAFLCALGATLGAFLGYLIGNLAWLNNYPIFGASKGGNLESGPETDGFPAGESSASQA